MARGALHIGCNEALHVLADDVGLDVYSIALAQVAQRRMSRRVIDDRDTHRVRHGQIVDGEAYTIDRD